MHVLYMHVGIHHKRHITISVESWYMGVEANKKFDYPRKIYHV